MNSLLRQSSTRCFNSSQLLLHASAVRRLCYVKYSLLHSTRARFQTMTWGNDVVYKGKRSFSVRQTCLLPLPTAKQYSTTMTKIYDFAPLDKKGEPFPFSQLKGKVVLIVNTASKCGFTPQFKGLEALYQKYKDRGFIIIGFPCNQFGNQDPGTNDEIQSFCQVNYGVTFPILGKIDVNGDKTDPVFKYLKSQKKQLGLERVKWNFEKFLINREGVPVERYSSISKPEHIAKDIESLL
ncbi:glutathione peroxidase Gpx1 [Schizosaccharomyces japonicus yFS275]|uniref:Glutathione peroxidase n=1 Tax=Schizosaccharomyces japonicus (strain yFS275 / FY16936) TaxID=402676 RepID=B6K027_SCHJY|nr:glutathione peroxidase Gpx1 [Schizosaccharomyces japonicus yFS275]EEB06177.2 glutathione peroxidase Gpx1 [Schizosaccharomyces japonicus yFS275]